MVPTIKLGIPHNHLFLLLIKSKLFLKNSIFLFQLKQGNYVSIETKNKVFEKYFLFSLITKTCFIIWYTYLHVGYQIGYELNFFVVLDMCLLVRVVFQLKQKYGVFEK